MHRQHDGLERSARPRPIDRNHPLGHRLFDVAARNPGGLLLVALGGRHLPVTVEFEARGLALVEPQPAFARLLEIMNTDHHIPGREHRKRIYVGDKLLHIVVGRPEHDVFWRARLHDAPAFHDGNAVADLEGLLKIVAHEDDGFLQRLLQLQKLILQFGPDQRIKCRERFIHQQYRRFRGKRPRQSHALLHAA